MSLINKAEIAWPVEVRSRLLALNDRHSDDGNGETAAKVICELDALVGSCFADAVVTACETFFPHQRQALGECIDLIACHGQTVWHSPDTSSTLQIGDAAIIAARTGVTTVTDFRSSDMAHGGQGAPVTSTFDAMFLAPPTAVGVESNGARCLARVLQNIGGIANCTVLPTHGGPPLAFDEGPGCCWIDLAAAECEERLRFDEGGRLAAEGRVNADLLEEIFSSVPFFSQPPPKTTGRELFSRALFEHWKARSQELAMSDRDLVATLTDVTARSIVDGIAQSLPAVGAGGVELVAVSGGGARNAHLMARLAELLDETVPGGVADTPRVQTHEDVLGVDSDFKEAIAFALLGFLCVTGRKGNVPSCTGARRGAILGKISPGDNFEKCLLAARGRGAGSGSGSGSGSAPSVRV